jgi:hypothetical protein
MTPDITDPQQSAILFTDFKQKNRLQSFFFVIMQFRVILFIILLVFLMEYPFVQGIILTVMNSMMLLSHIVARPYTQISIAIKELGSELLISVCHAAILILAHLGDTHDSDPHNRSTVGWIVVVTSGLMDIWNTVFGVVEILKAIGKALAATPKKAITALSLRVLDKKNVNSTTTNNNKETKPEEDANEKIPLKEPASPMNNMNLIASEQQFPISDHPQGSSDRHQDSSPLMKYQNNEVPTETSPQRLKTNQVKMFRFATTIELNDV